MSEMDELTPTLPSPLTRLLTLVVNGTPSMTTAATLQDWVAAQGVSPGALATAVNGGFVPRSLRAQTMLQEGDSILTFQPIQGG